MKKLSRKFFFKNHVEFIGLYFGGKEYLQKGDIFIFPSLGEGMAMQ